MGTHYQSHRKYWAETYQLKNIPLGEGDHCNDPAGNRNFMVCVNSFSGEAKFKKHTQLNVYTDGSKIENQAGWAFVTYKQQDLMDSRCGALPSTSTVFQAEVEAIRQCTKHLCTAQLGEAT